MEIQSICPVVMPFHLLKDIQDDIQALEKSILSEVFSFFVKSSMMLSSWATLFSFVWPGEVAENSWLDGWMVISPPSPNQFCLVLSFLGWSRSQAQKQAALCPPPAGQGQREEDGEKDLWGRQSRPNHSTGKQSARCGCLDLHMCVNTP